MDPLDAVLVVLGIAAAFHGLRLGAAIQLVSFGGFLLGLVGGVALVLLIDPHVHAEVPKTLVALGLLMLPATFLAGAGRQLGVRAWRAIRHLRFGVLDAVAGAFIAVGATLVVCWLFASILVNSAFPAVSRQIEQSSIIRGVQDVMPPVPDAFAAVERYLSTSGFPQVLVNILPESVGPVGIPNDAQVGSAVAAAGNSTVKIVALGCGQEQEGSGFVVNGGLVVTNAHVVAGTGSVTVLTPAGHAFVADVVLYDPDFDLAILRTPPTGLAPLQVDSSYVERGALGVVLGYPGGGPFVARPAGVFTRFAAEGRNIYDTSLTVRVVYALKAVVRPGNSGGPLVSPTGEVLGVVFSRSPSNSDLGYALASPGVAARIDAAEALHRAVSTEGCTN